MIKKSHDTQDLSVERAVLVGLIIKGEQDEDQLQEYLDELAWQKLPEQKPLKDLLKK